ncbi:hypothetical protein GCM10008026_06720 [Chelatococcus composti]|nr:hypothetical protein GCM10008026_06720 [Chelatococcus composti]
MRERDHRAKAYLEALLAEWRKHFREEWLPYKAVIIFPAGENGGGKLDHGSGGIVLLRAA